MTEQTMVHFHTNYDLQDYVINPLRKDGITFFHEVEGVEIVVRSKTGTEHSDIGYSNLEVRARVSSVASKAEVSFIESLIDGKYLSNHDGAVSLPYIDYGKTLIDEDGNIQRGYSPTWDMMPLGLQSLADAAHEAMYGVAIRFIQILRWQQRALGPASILTRHTKTPIIYWKTYHDQYHLAPLPRNEPIIINMSGALGGLQWGPLAQARFTDVWADTDIQEPLGHQLLREARYLRHENERACLLIAYSALGSGFITNR